MEIAYDLVEGGVARVRLAVRTPAEHPDPQPARPAVRARHHEAAARAGRTGSALRAAPEIGDLSEYGLPEPEEGIFATLMRLGVAPAIVDKEVIEAIKERRIEIVGGVESLDEQGVGLADGARIEPDAVIAATGYRCGLEPVVGHLGVLDERGVPSAPTGDEAAPGTALHRLPAAPGPHRADAPRGGPTRRRRSPRG